MKRLESLKNRKWYIAAVIWILLCLVAAPVYTTVTIQFAEDPSGESVATVFTSLRENVTAKGAKPRAIYEGIARISFYDLQYGSHCSVKRIDPLDSEWQREELVTISAVTVQKNGFLVWSAEGEALTEYFTGNEQVLFVPSEEGLSFYVKGSDPQLLVTEKFEAEYVRSGRLILAVTSSCFGIAVLVLLKMLVEWYGKGNVRKTDWFYLAGIAGAVCLCLYLANRSPFWFNPDEYEAKLVSNYYFEHWMPPDIRSDSIADSFACYGTTRHSEFNTFYFWTGKLGQWFSDAAVQCRILNMILFTVMAGIIVKNSRKYFALLPILLLTPQLWYIFSYSTSDALDFFVGFLCICELIKEDSLLNRLLREPLIPKKLPGYLLISLLFVHLFWAKLTFYPVLLFLFLILLIRLLEKPREERKPLLLKYIMIAGMTLGIFLIRYMITDFGYYGFGKQQVIQEMMEVRATYPYKPSTPPQEQAGPIYLYNKGLTLKEFFSPQMEFNKNLFRTVAGFFGRYDFGAPDWYYIGMAGLYLALFACLVYELKKTEEKKKWLKLGAVLLCIGVQYLLIVINGYFVDFQPQGRYMLPSLLYVAYFVSLCRDASNNKLIRLILCITCVMSLYAMTVIGLPNLIPQNSAAI